MADNVGEMTKAGGKTSGRESIEREQGGGRGKIGEKGKRNEEEGVLKA